MKPLAEPALKVFEEGQIEFVPERWGNVYRQWMGGIRDWCISRQIWWGHRIPIFYCDACGHEWASKGQPENCPSCQSATIRQDEDVLDTWFSSWLWPFSTFGWPQENADLAKFYPTNDLVTASEIIFFWVARMVMAGMEFMGDIPFSKVYIHGTVRDDQGRKMSKSLGNSIDPLDIIEKYSADALRFSLIMLTSTGQDVYISDEKFELGRNFGTKLWNASRFILINSKEWEGQPGAIEFDPALLSADDKHILAKLCEASQACTENLERFRFNDAAKTIYEFIWHQYCDRYVEYAKSALNGADPARREQVLSILHFALSRALLLLHPIMPFLTEELWHSMGYGPEEESIMTQLWPNSDDRISLAAFGIESAEVDYVEQRHELASSIRALRSDNNVPPKAKIELTIKPASPQVAAWLEADAATMAAMVGASGIAVDLAHEPTEVVPTIMSPIGSAYMPLDGLIDIDAERARLQGELADVQKHLLGAKKKLENENFVGRAPEAVVAGVRETRDGLAEKAEKLQGLLDAL